MTERVRIVHPVEFPGPAGRLEGLWVDPAKDASLPAAIICHPHPTGGGSMHNKVVHTVYRVLDAMGHPTLRFNFRGVGLSRGAYSGADDEVGDVAAAAARARAFSGRPALWVSGFSFGSWVGLKWALEDPGVARFIAIGMPVDSHPYDFLDHVPWPLLIVQGERDQYGSQPRLLALVRRFRGAPITARFVEDADHFFTGRMSALAHTLREALHGGRSDSK